jgi:hypothetical protein
MLLHIDYASQYSGAMKQKNYGAETRVLLGIWDK